MVRKGLVMKKKLALGMSSIIYQNASASFHKAIAANSQSLSLIENTRFTVRKKKLAVIDLPSSSLMTLATIPIDECFEISP